MPKSKIAVPHIHLVGQCDMTGFSDGERLQSRPLPTLHVPLSGQSCIYRMHVALASTNIMPCIRASATGSTCARCAGMAMRRASNRVPKRSLEPDFEMTQSVPNPKGRTARRGPTGSSKARKATFTATGAICQTAQGECEI